MTITQSQQDQLEQDLRDWARGITATTAGIELLIRHGRAIHPGAPWIKQEGHVTWLDAATLRDETGTYSGGEQRIFAIAASLLGAAPVDLSDVLASLDHHHTALVLAAICAAAGFTEPTRTIAIGDDGKPHWTTAPVLYTWPNRNQA